MSEKHVLVCDNCGKEDGDIADALLTGRRPELLPAGWFAVVGKSGPQDTAHFCSNKCVGEHFTDRTAPDGVPCEKCGPGVFVHPMEVVAHERKWHGDRVEQNA